MDITNSICSLIPPLNFTTSLNKIAWQPCSFSMKISISKQLHYPQKYVLEFTWSKWSQAWIFIFYINITRTKRIFFEISHFWQTIFGPTDLFLKREDFCSKLQFQWQNSPSSQMVWFQKQIFVVHTWNFKPKNSIFHFDFWITTIHIVCKLCY